MFCPETNKTKKVRLYRVHLCFVTVARFREYRKISRFPFFSPAAENRKIANVTFAGRTGGTCSSHACGARFRRRVVVWAGGNVRRSRLTPATTTDTLPALGASKASRWVYRRCTCGGGLAEVTFRILNAVRRVLACWRGSTRISYHCLLPPPPTRGVFENRIVRERRVNIACWRKIIDEKFIGRGRGGWRHQEHARGGKVREMVTEMKTEMRCVDDWSTRSK